MSRITTDKNDPGLGHGVDSEPTPQNEAYIVLSEEERAAGFVRPVRDRYVHVGAKGPRYELRDLPDEERDRHGRDYVKFENYPESESPKIGRAWTQAQLDAVGKGCKGLTRMARDIAETYARNPRFYGSTYCVHCRKHLPVSEFVWYGTSERVGS